MSFGLAKLIQKSNILRISYDKTTRFTTCALDRTRNALTPRPLSFIQTPDRNGFCKLLPKLLPLCPPHHYAPYPSSWLRSSNQADGMMVGLWVHGLDAFVGCSA
jgi:hypothetical protein